MVKKGIIKSFSEYPTIRITYCHSIYLPSLWQLITCSVFSNLTTFGIHPVKCQLLQTYVTISTRYFCSAQARHLSQRSPEDIPGQVRSCHPSQHTQAQGRSPISLPCAAGALEHTAALAAPDRGMADRGMQRRNRKHRKMLTSRPMQKSGSHCSRLWGCAVLHRG